MTLKVDNTVQELYLWKIKILRVMIEPTAGAEHPLEDIMGWYSSIGGEAIFLAMS